MSDIPISSDSSDKVQSALASVIPYNTNGLATRLYVWAAISSVTGTIEAGDVHSVNGIKPDEHGNVNVESIYSYTHEGNLNSLSADLSVVIDGECGHRLLTDIDDSSIREYSKTLSTSSLTSSEEYTDEKVGSIYDSLKNYSEFTSASALSTANEYSSFVATSALTATEGYASFVATSALTSAKDYTDTENIYTRFRLDSVFGTVSSCSGKWDDVYSTTNSHSATWETVSQCSTKEYVDTMATSAMTSATFSANNYTDNSLSTTLTGYVKSAVVTAMPENPAPNTLYFIVES